MTVIRVEAGPRGYEVMVGPVEAGIERILDLAQGEAPVLVSEPRVFALHGTSVAEALGAQPILVTEGEAAKDWDSLHSLLANFARLNISRTTPIVALGGGSVGDLAGLAASLFKRGCPVVHLPTTLLSQADSAIGGKTAIDAFGEKNLVGTFHQPTLVVVDPAFLDTLDERQMRSGYAEVLKYGLISNPEFFDWCETNGTYLLAGDRQFHRFAIEHCIRAKARFVTVDPDDTKGTRALLNFGHTFGHAIEALAGHILLHGEAVAIGMALAFAFSVELGICPASDAERVCAHLKAVGLPIRPRVIEGAAIYRAMLSDKKAGPQGLTLILTEGIGRAVVAKAVDPDQLLGFLSRSA